jgi:type I restriction enzyme S subunit
MGVGTLGRSSLFIDYRKKIVVDGCISVVRAKDLILSTYLFYILYDMEEELVNLSVGSTGQTTLRVEDILKLNILVPSTDLLKKFFDIASQNFEYKFNNQNKIENLNRIKNQILPLLMSGKIIIK